MGNEKKLSDATQKCWQTIWDPFQESEDFFRQQEMDYENTQKAYQHIVSTIDTALALGDCASLSDLIPYIESGNGYFAFQYIGKTHRLLRILNIITLEEKYQKNLFCQDCQSFEMLYEKYMLTIFSLRRLLFRLSPESVCEAVTYLQNHPISHFAAFWMIQGDLLIPSQDLCESLAAIYINEWSSVDTQQLYDLIRTLPNADLGEKIHEQS